MRRQPSEKFMRLPNELLEKVRVLPILEVVQDCGVELRARGYGRYVGPSPFRKESDGNSFDINVSKNLFADWKLASTHTGDVIKFYQLFYNISFPEAVIQLGGRYGLIPEEELSKYTSAKISRVRSEPLPEYQTRPIAQRATDEVCNTVYRAFVAECSLSEAHEAQLLERGFAKEEISSAGFFTFPSRAVMRRLIKRLGDSEIFKNVPGFYRREKGEAFTFSATNGIGIPVFDVNNNLRAIQIRRDDDANSNLPKYFWFSSSAYDGYKDSNGVCKGFDGAGTGSPIAFSQADDELWITEGIFKSIAIKRFFSHSTASVQGVGNWKDIDAILPKYSSYTIAYDADAAYNPAVAGQIKKLASHILQNAKDATVNVVFWDVRYGKGIDDLLISGNKQKVKKIAFQDWCARYDKTEAENLSNDVPFEEAYNKFFFN